MDWHSPILYRARLEKGTLPQGAVAPGYLTAIGHIHFFPLISINSIHVHQCHPMLVMAMAAANPSALHLCVVIVASNLGFAAGKKIQKKEKNHGFRYRTKQNFWVWLH